MERYAAYYEVSIDYLLGRAPNETAMQQRRPSPDLAFHLKNLLENKRLRTPAQIQLFTGAALTADELQRLRDGAAPGEFEEARLVKFFRKFPLDLIKAYYHAAGQPLPEEFQDIEADLREVISRVRMSTDGSPEALEAVIAVAREIWEKEKNGKK